MFLNDGNMWTYMRHTHHSVDQKHENIFSYFEQKKKEKEENKN